MQSTRVQQGVLHNPASDKRTTQGTFHVSEGGLPIPADKKAVPREVFARLFWHAMHPPKDAMLLPFTADMPARDRVHTFASLFLRPRVSPEVPGVSPYRDMEIDQPVFSRRSFLFFIVLAPACLLAVAGIVITLQVKQYRLLVADSPLVEAGEGNPDVVRTLLGRFAEFSAGEGPDTLRLSPADLEALVVASPAATDEGIRIRFTATDSHLVMESTRRVEELDGRLAWVFKRIAPIPDGWLNARVEGLPELKNRDRSTRRDGSGT